VASEKPKLATRASSGKALGKTHQPVEHLASLRAIPNCYTYRPADAVEVAECYEIALQNKTAPAVMALTRQGVPALRDDASKNMCERGAYILRAGKGADDIVLFASGSEVHLAVDAADTLEAQGVSHAGVGYERTSW